MADFSKEAMKAREVFALAFTEEMPARQFCLVAPQSARMSPAASRLYAQLRSQK